MIEQQTSRLKLIPMSVADLAFFHAANTDEFISEHLWDGEAIPVSLSRDILETVARCFIDEGWGLWKIILRGENASIGYVGLWRFFEESQPQLLYAIHKQYTGHGYASEASAKVVDYSFRRLGYDYLIASMNVENTSSVRLCQRIGFKLQEERTIEGKPTYFYRLENDA